MAFTPHTVMRTAPTPRTSADIRAVPVSDDPKVPLVLMAIVDGNGYIFGQKAANLAVNVLRGFSYESKALVLSLKHVFARIHTVLCEDAEIAETGIGVTACAVLINTVTGVAAFASIGDCGMWIVRNKKIIFNATVHHWNVQNELALIDDECMAEIPLLEAEGAHGERISFPSSRALGPIIKREKCMKSTPDITRVQLQPTDVIMLGSPGARSVITRAGLESVLDAKRRIPADVNAFTEFVWEEMAESEHDRVSRASADMVTTAFPRDTTLLVAARAT